MRFPFRRLTLNLCHENLARSHPLCLWRVRFGEISPVGRSMTRFRCVRNCRKIWRSNSKCYLKLLWIVGPCCFRRGTEKYRFGCEKMAVGGFQKKTTATLAYSRTANIIIITLKTLNDTEEKNWGSRTQNVALDNVTMCCVGFTIVWPWLNASLTIFAIL